MASSFAVFTGVSRAYARISSVQDINTSTIGPGQALLDKKQQQSTQEASMPNLHLVKILSPVKGQLILIDKDLTISGTSSDNTRRTSDCKVSVIVNGIKPYHPAYPLGQAGKDDYSKWNFTLTPSYTSIKQGQNKITAKFSCSNDPKLIFHNSVNVTGVTLLSKSELPNEFSNNNNADHSPTLTIITIPTLHNLQQSRAPFRLPFH